MVVCLTHIPTYIPMNIDMNINIPKGPMPQFFFEPIFMMTRDYCQRKIRVSFLFLKYYANFSKPLMNVNPAKVMPAITCEKKSFSYKLTDMFFPPVFNDFM